MKHSLSEPGQGLTFITLTGAHTERLNGAIRPSNSAGLARREGEYFSREGNKVLQVLTKLARGQRLEVKLYLFY
jgi:hypothetical protein